jgi:hypothetical protein
MQDMLSKGRARPAYKLTKEQRAEIAKSSLPTRLLAEQYKVTTARIRQIKRGI